MMKKLLKKHWPLIGIGILLVVVSFYLTRSWNEILQGRTLTNIFSEEGIKLENINYTQNSPDDGMKWNLDAKEVKFSKDRQFISFRDFRLKLEPENRPSVELEGKRGDYDRNSGEINLHGDLQGHTNDGYRIITQHILYKHKEGLLKTEEPVKIMGPFFSIAGRGLYLNLEKETLRIISGVTTSIYRESFML
ncbi:MAG: LPS export ABC transporter periplasmic protein LptC [Deltaproteobacteria bacterium]|nr:LPS export ABC transporter periplasmic protein LptC [Deltaproteobacteria bacterium]